MEFTRHPFLCYTGETIKNLGDGMKDRRKKRKSGVKRKGNGGAFITRTRAARERSLAQRRGGKKTRFTITPLFRGLFFLSILALAVWLLFLGGRGLAGAIQNSFFTNAKDGLPRPEKTILVEGVDIKGMTKEEAKEAVLTKYPWKMEAKLRGQEEIYPLDNLLEPETDRILEEIYGNVKEAQASYTFDTSRLNKGMDGEISKIKEKWNIPPQNGSISGFDKESNTFTYTREVPGQEIDALAFSQEARGALERRDYEARIEVNSKEVVPEVTEEEAKAKNKVIGTFTTKTTANQDRNTNIQIAAQALDGLILQPGEEFSFNNTTGNRTPEKGYRPAGAYVNGVLAEEPGGGVCQVSSTLYNAVIFSGLATTERHAHSFEPSYVTPGEDAMVSYDGYAGPDMKFVNTSHTAIAIRAVFTDQTLTCSIIGIPILEEGVSVSMTSQKTAQTDPPQPEYIEDSSLRKGREVVVRAAVPGSRWVTNYVVKKEGTVIRDEFFHNSIYKGKPAAIKRNSGGAGTDTKTSAAQSTAKTTESTGEASSQAPSQSTETRETGSENRETRDSAGENTQENTKESALEESKTTEPVSSQAESSREIQVEPRETSSEVPSQTTHQEIGPGMTQ